MHGGEIDGRNDDLPHHYPRPRDPNVLGYYNGSWTTDRCRALDLRKREVAEAHAARMRECCPRNADLIKVEKLDAAD